MKVKMSDLIDDIPVSYEFGKIVENILRIIYPTYFGENDTESITDPIILSIANKFSALKVDCIGRYENVAECVSTLSTIVIANTYAHADYLSFLNEDKMSTIPKENIMQIIRSGESTNKTMGEDTPMFGDASFNNFTINSPSAKAISKNEASGTDTHKDDSVDIYLKRQKAYENFISYANWVENIFRILTVDYTVAY